MLFAFVDESYSENFYYVGAFVLPEEQIRSAKEAVRRVQGFATSFGVTDGAELHAHQIMSGAGEWSALRGRHRAAVRIYDYALGEFAKLPAKVVVRGVNVAGLIKRYPNPRPPHVVALSHCLEDVDAFAKAQGEKFIVIADELPDQLDHVRRVERYRLVGTGGYRSSMLESLEPPIRFGDSRESPGLQIADLIVYLYRRRDSHVETNPKSAASVQRLWARTQPLKPRTWRWNP